MIFGLWDCQVDTIIDVKLRDTDVETARANDITPGQVGKDK